MPIKFKSDYSLTIDGFFFPKEACEFEPDPTKKDEQGRPEPKRDEKGALVFKHEGDSAEGILVDFARNSEFPFYVLEIVEDQESLPLKVQDEKSGEALQEIVHGVAKGQRIGLSNWSEFKGLEKYIGHHIAIFFTGYETLSRAREKRTFYIEVSDRPVRPRQSREARRNGGFQPRS